MSKLVWIGCSVLVVAGMSVPGEEGALSCTGAPEEGQTEIESVNRGQQVELVAPGVISLPDRNETFPAIDPRDGSLWFSTYDDSFDDQTIMVASPAGDTWTRARVAPFSGRWGDRAPRFSPDGTVLYFTSNRPRSAGDTPADMNIWRVERTADGWGDPKLIGDPVNSDANDMHPSITDRAIWVASRRAGGAGNSDIFRVNASGEIRRLGPQINDEKSQPDLWVSPDESWMILVVTDHPDGYGGDDLFVSRFVEGAWTAPRNLGAEVNSDEYEYGPNVSTDGDYLYFTSHRSGTADVYRAPISLTDVVSAE